ncbi:MAG: Tol-Pal system beta propeller repeat protein TolB [Pseudomonadota bacterium]
MIRSFLAAVALIFATGLMPAAGQIAIEVNEGTYKPYPIAIPDFNAAAGEEEIAGQISEVVRQDLLSTGLFQMTDPEAFIQKDLSVNLQPRFADWRIIQADGLVVGEVSFKADGSLLASFRIWDVNGEQVYRVPVEDEAGRVTLESGKAFSISPESWRRLGHKIADVIYQRLTGEDGYLDTRIVYIAETGPKTDRMKRLAIMDQDGANQQFLTRGDHQIITPRFSPTEQRITYMSFEGGRPRVYLFNLRNGRQESLGNFPGMTFAPRFSPDGNSVIFSQAQRGNTDVFVMDLVTRQTRRLTDHPSIDTSPSMSPDGSQVVFNSDRGGSPQLYVMNTDGSPLDCPSGGRDKACRITFGQGRYSTPVWSPRGDLIAFTKQYRGRFHIGVIGYDGEGERLLTEAYLDEGPGWAPNGRVITFFRENRPGAGPQLWSVDLTGRNLNPIVTTTEGSDPAWSPLLE